MSLTVDELAAAIQAGAGGDPEHPPPALAKAAARAYAVRLTRLQDTIDPGPGGAELFRPSTLEDVPAIWRAIEGGRASRGGRLGAPWSLATKLGYAIAVAGAYRRLPGFEAQKAEHAARMSELQAAVDEVASENRMTTREQGKDVPWPELVSAWEAQVAMSAPRLSPRDLALYGLFVAIPPRRLTDYRLMRIARPPLPRKGLDPEANWLILDGNGRPARLVYNVYKSAGTYGRQERLNIPPALGDVLQELAAGAETGAPLFATAAGEPYATSTFGGMLARVAQKLTGKPVGATAFRHSAVTHFLAKRRSLKARTAFATQMAHSPSRQAAYEWVEGPSASYSSDGE